MICLLSSLLSSCFYPSYTRYLSDGLLVFTRKVISSIIIIMRTRSTNWPTRATSRYPSIDLRSSIRWRCCIALPLVGDLRYACWCQSHRCRSHARCLGRCRYLKIQTRRRHTHKMLWQRLIPPSSSYLLSFLIILYTYIFVVRPRNLFHSLRKTNRVCFRIVDWLIDWLIVDWLIDWLIVLVVFWRLCQYAVCIASTDQRKVNNELVRTCK